MIIINKKNFDGNWEYIPKKGNTQSQIILSKMINNKNVIYNFNADKYDDCLGKPNSLMDELLSLDKDSFYKRIISNDSIKFIRISEDEYKKYFKKEKELGISVRDKLREKILNKVVKIKCGDFDKYGRLLVEVITDEGENIKEWLINNKYAFAYDGGTKKKWSVYLNTISAVQELKSNIEDDEKETI